MPAGADNGRILCPTAEPYADRTGHWCKSQWATAVMRLTIAPEAADNRLKLRHNGLAVDLVLTAEPMTLLGNNSHAADMEWRT